MSETTEKIKEGFIRIENGRLIGLGVSGEESIDLNALNELMEEITPKELSEVFGDTVQRLGTLGLYLYKAGTSIPDPQGALISAVPDEGSLYYMHLVSKLFNK